MDIFFQALAGIIIGGFITWSVSRYYFSRTSKDLYEDVSRPVLLILEGLEKAAIVEWTRDEQGKPVSITLKISVAEKIGVKEELETKTEGQ